MIEMKLRLLASILFIAILMTPMFGPVLAQSNHTLEWGVDPGEEFTYVLQRAYYADSNNRVFIVSLLPFLAESVGFPLDSDGDSFGYRDNRPGDIDGSVA